jgi:hypothetical protein
MTREHFVLMILAFTFGVVAAVLTTPDTLGAVVSSGSAIADS